VKPLSNTMVDALVAFRASDEDFGDAPTDVREGTRIALEERGLIESREHSDPRRRRWYEFEYRRTVRGDDVAIEATT
jgi:hypothetical protein